MGGGIGVTPMISFAHRLYALGKKFELHYSVNSKLKAGYLDDLKTFPWSDKVHFHFSDEGTRADFNIVLGNYKKICKFIFVVQNDTWTLLFWQLRIRRFLRKKFT